MLPKIVFLLSVLLLFAASLQLQWWFVNKKHKGRMIDAVIQILMFVGFMVLLSLYGRVFDHFFSIF